MSTKKAGVTALTAEPCLWKRSTSRATKLLQDGNLLPYRMYLSKPQISNFRSVNHPLFTHLSISPTILKLRARLRKSGVAEAQSLKREVADRAAKVSLSIAFISTNPKRIRAITFCVTSTTPTERVV